jgi:hypothetical protein
LRSDSVRRALLRHKSRTAAGASRPQHRSFAETAEPLRHPNPVGHGFADRTRSTHAAVHALLKAGHSGRAIQRQLHMTSRTVKRYADAAKPEDVFTGRWQAMPSVLDEYKTYLDDAGARGAPTPGKYWRKSSRSGTKAATGAFAPTSTSSAPHRDP